jgi:hypothetical protein
MRLRRRVNRLTQLGDAKRSEGFSTANPWSELLELASVEELRRLRDLRRDVDLRMPPGTAAADCSQYMSASELTEFEAICSALRSRHEGATSRNDNGIR